MKKDKLINENKKIKILVYADSSCAATGFGSVTRNIFYPLAKTGRYDIDIFGINDRGQWKNPSEHPCRIYPAMRPGDVDFYGRLRFLNILRGADSDLKPSWDIIFTLQDHFILEQFLSVFGASMMRVIQDELKKEYHEKLPPEKWFKTVSYWPVDSPIRGNWIEEAVALSDYSYAYTEYGKREIIAADQMLTKPTNVKAGVIYHGTDTEHFFPVSQEKKKEFRNRFFKGKVSDETFLVICVARNQTRKDLPRVMKIFKEFQRRRPNSFLYLHSKDRDAGGTLKEHARNFELEFGKDWAVPANFDENIGFPLEGLNMIYNVADVQILATKGEGWCLPVTEAMAAGTLSLAPNITSIPEIFGTEGNNIDDISELDTNTEIRGIPIRAGSNTSEWIGNGPEDFERIRPLTNVDDAVKKLIWVYDNPDKAKEIVERGRKWVQQYSWTNIVNIWDGVFQMVYNELEKERTQLKQAVDGNKKNNLEKGDQNGKETGVSTTDESGAPKTDSV